jgi:hypothetical protein
MQDAFGVFESRTDVANAFEVVMVATTLGECRTRNSQYHSQHPVVDGFSLSLLSPIDIVYGSVKARFIEDWYELEEVIEVVLHKLSGYIVRW